MLLKRLFAQVGDVIGLMMLLVGLLIASGAFDRRPVASGSRERRLKREGAVGAHLPNRPLRPAA